MLASGARGRLVDMVKGSCGEGDMNTAAAIHNDVISDSGKDNGIRSSMVGSEGHTARDGEHVHFCPPRELEEEHSSLEADRDSNTRGQQSRFARPRMGRVDWEA